MSISDELDPVVVEKVEEGRVLVAEASVRRNPLTPLAILAGVAYLAANVFVIVRTPAAFVSKNVTGSTSLLLVISSIVICLALIGGGLALRRSAVSAWSAAAVLLLALLAPLATVWALQVNRSAGDRYNQSVNATKPCLDIYSQAQTIAKDNPKFRMPEKDRDEVRCAVNKALGR